MKEKFENIIYKVKNKKSFKNFSEKWQDIHTITVFFLVCFGAILWKIFDYTILDYDFYTALADKQQIGTFAVPVNRGTIYSSIERDGKHQKSSYLATSINLYDLAIDPNEKGDKEKLGEFLVDLVYTEICEGKTREKCRENLFKFLRVLDLEDYQYSTEYIKKAISGRITPRINQKKVTNVLIGSDFTEEEINQIEKLNIPGFYTNNTSISMNPEIYNKEKIDEIATILGMTRENLERITRKRDLRYVQIYNKISISSSEKINNLIKEEKQAISKSILKREDSIYSFFILNENPTRYYPEGQIAAQIVGFVDNNGIGRYGLEGFFNSILKGNNGKIIARKDINGKIIETIQLEKDDLIGEGIEIVTTIDRNIQKKVEEILAVGVRKYLANRGTIVVTEPKTGKVIAMANFPTYDVNNYTDVYEIEKVLSSKFPNPQNDLVGHPVFIQDSENGSRFIYDNKEIYLREATYDELGNPALVKYRYKNADGAGVYKNNAISSLYEPGSIMKAITVAIGIDTGEINEYSKYDDKGSVKIDQFEIGNESSACLGYHTFEHALDYSCNVGMIRIFQRVGKALVHEYFENFGFGEPTGIDLEGEVYSPLGSWEKWSTAGLFTKSYGLGISVTPLQMAAAYNVLANGGIYVKPKIIEEINYPNGTKLTFKTEEKRRVIKESTSKLITKMLAHGVTDGLASKGAVDGYSIAGKTGTAQILHNGRYQSGPGWTNASYAGYGPVEDPKFVIIVKLERPRRNVYGAMTSGELFSQVASYLFDYYGIPKSKK